MKTVPSSAIQTEALPVWVTGNAVISLLNERRSVWFGRISGETDERRSVWFGRISGETDTSNILVLVFYLLNHYNFVFLLEFIILKLNSFRVNIISFQFNTTLYFLSF